MALLGCSECGNSISDKAYLCPFCGCPDPFSRMKNAEGYERERQKYLAMGYKPQLSFNVRKHAIFIKYKSTAILTTSLLLWILSGTFVVVPMCWHMLGDLNQSLVHLIAGISILGWSLLMFLIFGKTLYQAVGFKVCDDNQLEVVDLKTKKKIRSPQN